MKVILCETIDGLGHKGDVVNIADGYARNSLIPQGKVLKATAGAQAHADEMKRSWIAKNAQNREAAEVLAKQLAAQVVTVGAKVGKEGKLFGSVTATDIAEALTTQTLVDIDKKMVVLDESLRTTGEHSVNLRLHPEVEVALRIVVEEA